jgi:ABC-2 type transport system permease protein
MRALVGAEFLKLRTTRSFWWVVVLSLALPTLITISNVASQTFSTESDARSLLSAIGTAGLLMLVLGVVSSAGEYRHGTITSTFLVAPDRRRVLLAKALAAGIVGLAVALASAVLVIGISAPWLSGDGHSLSSLGIGSSELIGIVAGAAAYVAISAMLGVGVGALLTNQVAAVVGVLVVLFIVDPVIVALVDSFGKFSLTGIGIALSGGTGHDAGFHVFSAATAALVYLGYAAAFTLAAAVAAQRRDVA